MTDRARTAHDADRARIGAAAADHSDQPALVPRDGLFEGQIAVVGETRIEGAVQGSLRGPGTLVLSEHGQIEGLIECDRVDADGRVLGPIRAGRHARLGAHARIEGDVEAPALEVADDAIWNGRARIG